jgi:hypothetical protein
MRSSVRSKPKQKPQVKTMDEAEVQLAVQYLSAREIISYLQNNKSSLAKPLYEELYLKSYQKEVASTLAPYPEYDVNKILENCFGDIYVPGKNTRNMFRKYILPLLEELKFDPEQIAAAINSRSWLEQGGAVSYSLKNEYMKALWRDLPLGSDDRRVLPFLNQMPTRVQAKAHYHLDNVRETLATARQENYQHVSNLLAGNNKTFSSFTNFAAIREFIAELAENDNQYAAACRSVGISPNHNLSLSVLAAGYFHQAFENGHQLTAIIDLIPESKRADFLRQHGSCSANGIFARTPAENKSIDATINTRLRK